jgi:hypothetical protein
LRRRLGLAHHNVTAVKVNIFEVQAHAGAVQQFGDQCRHTVYVRQQTGSQESASGTHKLSRC